MIQVNNWQSGNSVVGDPRVASAWIAVQDTLFSADNLGALLFRQGQMMWMEGDGMRL